MEGMGRIYKMFQLEIINIREENYKDNTKENRKVIKKQEKIISVGNSQCKSIAHILWSYKRI